MKTAHQEWMEFAEQIGLTKLDPTGKSNQYIESRRCFYAGMMTMITTMMEAADSTPDTPAGEERAGEMLDSLFREIVAFNERMAKGIA